MSSRNLNRNIKANKRKNSRSPAEQRHGEGVRRGHKVEVCNFCST